MEETIQVLKQLNDLAERYYLKLIPFKDFFSQLSQLLGALDPLDEILEELDSKMKREVMFFNQFGGGELGEFEKYIPRKKDWKYGDKEEYGWINQVKYYTQFSK